MITIPAPITPPAPDVHLTATLRSGQHLPETQAAMNASCNRDTVFYSPVWVEEPVVMGTIGVYVGTGVASCVASIGLYADDNYSPADRIGQYVNSASVASTGQVQATGLTVELERGIYWRALVATGGASHPSYRAIGGFSRWIRPDSTNNLGAAAYTEAGSALPLTATPGATVFQCPRIYMVVA